MVETLDGKGHHHREVANWREIRPVDQFRRIMFDGDDPIDREGTVLADLAQNYPLYDTLSVLATDVRGGRDNRPFTVLFVPLDCPRLLSEERVDERQATDNELFVVRAWPLNDPKRAIPYPLVIDSKEGAEIVTRRLASKYFGRGRQEVGVEAYPVSREEFREVVLDLLGKRVIVSAPARREAGVYRDALPQKKEKNLEGRELWEAEVVSSDGSNRLQVFLIRDNHSAIADLESIALKAGLRKIGNIAGALRVHLKPISCHEFVEGVANQVNNGQDIPLFFFRFREVRNAIYRLKFARLNSAKKGSQG